MTDQVILTQTERVVAQQPGGTVVQRIDAGTVVVTGIMGPAGESGISTITAANDIDSSGLIDGCVLVYRTNTTKWVATTELNTQIIDGGSY